MPMACKNQYTFMGSKEKQINACIIIYFQTVNSDLSTPSALSQENELLFNHRKTIFFLK